MNGHWSRHLSINRTIEVHFFRLHWEMKGHWSHVISVKVTYGKPPKWHLYAGDLFTYSVLLPRIIQNGNLRKRPLQTGDLYIQVDVVAHTSVLSK